MSEDAAMVEAIRNNMINDITELDNRISELSRDLESLQRFKQSVQSARNDFQEANSRERTILDSLQVVEIHNTVIEKYKEGMGDSLTSIGMRIGNKAYGGLLYLIDAKITACTLSIKDMEAVRFSKQMKLNMIEVI